MPCGLPGLRAASLGWQAERCKLADQSEKQNHVKLPLS